MDVADRFGENLRRCRRRAGFSQEELGMRSSLHRTEIGRIEQGAVEPRLTTLMILADGLDVHHLCHHRWSVCPLLGRCGGVHQLRKKANWCVRSVIARTQRRPGCDG